MLVLKKTDGTDPLNIHKKCCQYGQIERDNGIKHKLTCWPTLLQVVSWGCSRMLMCASREPGLARLRPPDASEFLFHNN